MSGLSEYVKQKTNGQLRASEISALAGVPQRTMYHQWDHGHIEKVDGYIEKARAAKKALL